MSESRGGLLQVDCGSLRKIDSLSLAWLGTLRDAQKASGGRMTLKRLSPEMKARLSQAFVPAEQPPERAVQRSLAVATGESAMGLFDQVRDTLVLLSESLYWSTVAVFRKKTLLPEDTTIQMVRLGSSALPIVLLLSTLIGFTLALQSGVQLQKFGAAIFLASGMGITMVTEIGPLMTAVILAGRSGSAITAEISTMMVQEEVSALHSMAVNPIHFLVLPRFWAMSLTMPLLTMASAASGIFAAMIVGLLFFRLSPASFMQELQSSVTINYLGQGLIKAVTFAWIIVLVAINKGISVRGGADAVGRATTSCVVTCIFSIILADAVFSFIFYY